MRTLANKPLRADVAAGILAGVTGLVVIVMIWTTLVFPAPIVLGGGSTLTGNNISLTEHEWGFAQFAKGGPKICAVAGQSVNITLSNTGQNLHGFQIVYAGNFTRVDGQGLNSTDLLTPLGPPRHITIHITQPGTYYYICPVPGHRLKGMIAPCVVQSSC